MPFQLLIYGEGRKIERSLAYFRELPEYQHKANRLYYFGDIDPEGIAIYECTTELYAELSLEPCRRFYAAMLELVGRQAPKLRTKQQIEPSLINRFMNRFPDEVSTKMRQVLESGCYIPQEALDYNYFSTVFHARQEYDIAGPGV
jgi:hypothetical protein